MFNLLISAALGGLIFAGVGAAFGPWAAIVPAILVWGGSIFLLSRRTGQQVEAAMAPVGPLLQAGKVDEARAVLESVRQQYGNWQLLLDGSINAQLGMLEYLQLKWDKALPLLQAGRFRNWMAMVSIGCIHYRKGDKDKAWEEFEAAAGASEKEAIIYAVWATLAVRSGDRDRALKALSKGLEANPESDFLKNLKKTVANKKKINTKRFPDAWYQFFPEDMVRQQMMRGRRDGQGLMQQQIQQARPGAKATFRAR